jgi:WD40 repeat protein
VRFCVTVLKANRWAFFQWLLQAKSVVGSVADTEHNLAKLRQQWSAKKQQLLAELQSQRHQVWQQLERRQREDLRECWSHVQRGMASVSGKYVVSGSDDKTVRVWDLATGKEVRRFTGHQGAVLSVAVTPDGR